ncbi:hypothetical protein RQP46_008108 [Phenoliferia psychrophenolica]
MATIQSLAPEILSHIFELAHDAGKPSTILISGVKDFKVSMAGLPIDFWDSPDLQDATIIPATVVDLSITLSVPSGIPHLLPFFAAVQNLHHITLDFLPHQSYISVFSFFGSLAGFLPASIKRLSIKNVGDPNTTAYPLAYTPFLDLLDLISTDRLPNLTRIDFPVCKRKDLEDEAAAADLLAECERHSIRIVCWEDFI